MHRKDYHRQTLPPFTALNENFEVLLRWSKTILKLQKWQVKLLHIKTKRELIQCNITKCQPKREITD